MAIVVAALVDQHGHTMHTGPDGKFSLRPPVQWEDRRLGEIVQHVSEDLQRRSPTLSHGTVVRDIVHMSGYSERGLE